MSPAKVTRSLSTQVRPNAVGAWCEVLSGTAIVSRHVLNDAVAIVGQDEEVDVPARDETVSRRHASLEHTPRGVMVRDLGSRNGTWYLGARISEALVPFGATVRVGRTLLRLVTDAPKGSGSELTGLLGTSAAMAQLRAQLSRLTRSDVALLLRGETGTGKEVAARELHRVGPRAKGEFVVFDASHTGRELLESQLFGHRRGAFTGATDNRVGAVEQADGGTLFLDEVGDLELEAQVRLLRVLETGRFTRLGDTVERSSDFRLISSTQRDLEALVRAGRFREDLYFRLAVVVIDVPALRQREEDIALLAEHFARERGVTLDGFTLTAWRKTDWRGNVRELKNAVERAALTVHAPDAVVAPVQGRQQVMASVERTLVVQALEEHGYDVAAAAARLGLSRSQLYRIMQRYGLQTKRRSAK